MKLIIFICSLLFINAIIFASSFSDLKSSDPNFKDFQYAIKNGYFSKYDDGSIKPDSFLTRREASILIKKFSNQLSSTRLTLNSNDIKQLNQLAKSYKSIYTSNENTITLLKKENNELKKSNEIIKKDMILLNDSMAKMKKERRLLFTLIGISTLIGTLL